MLSGCKKYDYDYSLAREPIWWIDSPRLPYGSVESYDNEAVLEYCKSPRGHGKEVVGSTVADMLACLFDVFDPPCEYNHVTHMIR